MRARLYGSRVRGEADRLSDIDILVMSVEPYNQAQRQDISAVLATGIQDVLGADAEAISVAWYSEARLCQMYADGHLFAWHLFLESVKFLDASADFLDTLGRPSRYLNATVDIGKFYRIMLQGQAALLGNPRNACYEAGMMYLCCRNVAMCASWYSGLGLKFGRYSPYEILDLPRFPLERDVYSRFAQARIEPARYGTAPNISFREVEDGYKVALEWCRMMAGTVVLLGGG